MAAPISPGAWRGWYNRILSSVGHDGHLAIFDADAVDHHIACFLGNRAVSRSKPVVNWSIMLCGKESGLLACNCE
jgi:hypothetical protein